VRSLWAQRAPAATVRKEWALLRSIPALLPGGVVTTLADRQTERLAHPGCGEGVVMC
jgi:hypothetical protein